MKGTDGGCPEALAGLTDLVDRRRKRHIADFIAVSAQPPTEIRVFPIEEIPLIESVHSIERVTTSEHAGARQPIDRHASFAGPSVGGDDIAP